LGGNVWEWVKDWHDPNGPTSGIPPRPTEEAYFLDDVLDLATGANSYKKGILGGSFNYFVATMANSWNHSAFLHAGNDHFGFRVVKNE
jgi:sulfatase modifying factor 1